MQSSITPTIGRKVWLWLKSATVQYPNQAFDATIVCVNPENNQVNLTYSNHWGTSSALHQIELRDPLPTDCHGVETYATWMPYQIEQQKKSASQAAVHAHFDQAKQEEGVASNNIRPDPTNPA